MSHKSKKKNKGINNSGRTESTLPDWYWNTGLHDAEITGIKKKNVSAYYRHDEETGEWIRNESGQKGGIWINNVLILKIDACGAIYDSSVTEIRLFNYRILSEDVDLFTEKEVFWMSDRLTRDKNGYVLEIDVDRMTKENKYCTYVIRFLFAEVDREE